ncbi:MULTISPECIES: hypothetical protein [unclassified Marinomonas]|uniref:hypothetical protein n=1 Tax=unclassified Marinomonas TaxID=196814 RepID=UPI0007AF9FDC|nr:MULTISPECIES: hypothetical protein [unclassified Marinomonas]
MNKFQKCALVIVTGAALTACGSSSTKPAEVAGSISPVDESVQAESIYNSAKADYELWLGKMKEIEPLELYSKSIYKETLSSWAKAVDVYEDFADDPAKAVKDYSIFSSGTYAEEYNEKLAIVKVNHAKLLDLKDKADTILADSIDQMEYLDSIEAEKHFKQNYRTVKNAYVALFAYVADNDIGDAQNKQAAFLNTAKKLELRVVLKVNIEPLEKEAAQLKKSGIATLAPISYNKVTAELTLATSEVENNARNQDVILAATKKVKFEIDHTTQVANEVQRLRSTSNLKFEAVALEVENRLLEISKAIDGSDFRDKPVRVQKDMIVDLIEELTNTDNATRLENEVASLKAKLEASQNKLSQEETSLAEANKQQEVLRERIESLQQQLTLKQSLVDKLTQDLADQEALPQ